MGAYLPDILTMIEAGIDPMTNKPIKSKKSDAALMLQTNKTAIRIMDEQDAVNRYQWFNLPDGLDGELVERILYYRYTGMFFYNKKAEKFYFLPYTPKGVDVYGRYVAMTAIPFNGSTIDVTSSKKIEDLLSSQEYKPQWEVLLPEEIDIEVFETSAVILNDYCKQISQKWLPRWMLNDPVCQLEAECLSYLNTAMIGASGVKGLKVESGDDEKAAGLASRQIKEAALSGEIYVPIQQSVKIEELADRTGNSRLEEFMMAMQSLDNYRLSLYGLDSGGVFEKKAHILESEQLLNKSRVALVYQDGLNQRQKFCNIVNSIWGLSIWCEPSESVIAQDLNGDNVLFDVQNNTVAEEPTKEGSE